MEENPREYENYSEWAKVWPKYTPKKDWIVYPISFGSNHVPYKISDWYKSLLKTYCGDDTIKTVMYHFNLAYMENTLIQYIEVRLRSCKVFNPKKTYEHIITAKDIEANGGFIPTMDFSVALGGGMTLEEFLKEYVLDVNVVFNTSQYNYHVVDFRMMVDIKPRMPFRMPF